MHTPFDELERPGEWLRALAEGRASYAELVADSGSLAVAAFRVARARCRVQPVPSPVPSAAELHAAATEVHRACRLAGGVPSAALLVTECEHEGFAIVVPTASDAA